MRAELPELPQSLVSFRLGTNNLSLNQEILRDVLKKLGDFALSVDHGSEELKQLFDSGLADVRSAFEARLVEVTTEFRTNTAELSQQLLVAREHVTQAVTDLREHDVRFDALEQKLEELHVREHKPLHGDACSDVPFLLNSPAKGSTEKGDDDNEDEQNVMQLSSMVSVVSDYQDQELAGEVTRCRRHIESLQDIVRSLSTENDERLAQIENALEECSQWGRKIQPLEHEVQRISANLTSDHRNMGQTVGQSNVVAEIKRLKDQIAEHDKITDSRLTAIESQPAPTVMDEEEITTLRATLGQIDGRISKVADSANEFSRRTDSELRRKAMELQALEEHAREHEMRLNNMESQIRHNQLELRDAIGGKANISDMTTMRAVISSVSEELKDREQAVLFGARCLSCNRVYDDIQKDAGVVEPPNGSAKQQALVLAEIQKALQSQRPDSQSISMLAVKVGRPGNISARSGLGPFAGRQDTMACGIEDVSILPARLGAEGRALLYAGGSSSRNGSPRLDRGQHAVSRPNTSPASPGSPRRRPSLHALRTKPKDGPFDYKQSLSQLVGLGSTSSGLSAGGGQASPSLQTSALGPPSSLSDGRVHAPVRPGLG